LNQIGNFFSNFFPRIFFENHDIGWLTHVCTCSLDRDRWERWPVARVPWWCSRWSCRAPTSTRTPRWPGWWRRCPEKEPRDILISGQARKRFFDECSPEEKHALSNFTNRLSQFSYVRLLHVSLV
jgi:hypothetical protein